MAMARRVIELEDIDTLSTLAEEVASTGRAVVLRKHGHDLAMVTPLTTAAANSDIARSDEDVAAFRNAAGGWRGIVDEDALEEIYRSRTVSTRAPIDL